MFCRNYVKRRRHGMGRPSFHTASVSLRGSGFGDSGTHVLKVSKSSTKLNILVGDRSDRLDHMH